MAPATRLVVAGCPHLATPRRRHALVARRRWRLPDLQVDRRLGLCDGRDRHGAKRKQCCDTDDQCGLFHGVVLLRPYNQNAKREAWEDLKKLLHFVYD